MNKSVFRKVTNCIYQYLLGLEIVFFKDGWGRGGGWDAGGLGIFLKLYICKAFFKDLVKFYYPQQSRDN